MPTFYDICPKNIFTIFSWGQIPPPQRKKWANIVKLGHFVNFSYIYFVVFIVASDDDPGSGDAVQV